MRVTVLTQLYKPSPGGVQQLLSDLAEGLVHDYGDEVLVLTTPGGGSGRRPGPRQVRTEVIDGVSVSRFPVARRHLRPLRFLVKLDIWLFGRYLWHHHWEAGPPGRLRALSGTPTRHRVFLVRWASLVLLGPMSWSLARAFRRTRDDVVIVSSLPYLHCLWPMLLRRRPVVVVGALHHDHVPLRPLMARALRHADAYLALSDHEARMVAEAYGVDPSRTHRLVPPVDDVLLAQGADRMQRAIPGPGSITYGHVGRESWPKRVDLIVAAMETVWDRDPEAELVLAGSPGDASGWLTEQIDALPEERRRRIRRVGRYEPEDKPAIYASIDVFVCASGSESYGLALLDAHAAGCAVLATETPAIDEVVVHDETGLLVAADDAEALARAMTELAGDPERRRALASEGHRRAAAEHRLAMATASLRRQLQDAIDR